MDRYTWTFTVTKGDEELATGTLVSSGDFNSLSCSLSGTYRVRNWRSGGTQKVEGELVAMRLVGSGGVVVIAKRGDKVQ